MLGKWTERGTTRHVGMLLTEAAYENYSPNRPFLIPDHPGVFNVQQGATQCQIALETT